MLRKKIYFIVLLVTALTITVPGIAQTEYYIYTYDASGNRIQREKDLSKSAKIRPGNGNEKSETNIEGTIEGFKITIYPNPTNGLLNVSIPGLKDETASLFIYNLQGKQVYNKKLGATLSEIDLKSQPSGMYILRIYIGENSTEWKVIKN